MILLIFILGSNPSFTATVNEIPVVTQKIDSELVFVFTIFNLMYADEKQEGSWFNK